MTGVVPGCVVGTVPDGAGAVVAGVVGAGAAVAGGAVGRGAVGPAGTSAEDVGFAGTLKGGTVTGAYTSPVLVPALTGICSVA